MRLALLVVLVLSAGCLTPAVRTLGAVNVGELSLDHVLSLGNETATVGQMLDWQGRILVYDPVDTTLAPCSPKNCDVIWFHVDVPEAGWKNRETLRVMITNQPDGRQGDFDMEFPRFELLVTDPNGRQSQAVWARYAKLLLFEEPIEGDYRVEIQIRHEYEYPEPPVITRAGYEGFLRIDPVEPAATSGIVLPDLAITAIQDFRVEYGQPVQGFPSLGASPAPWAPGCGVDEYIDQQATRCMRVTVSLGNLGPARLQLLFSGTSEEPQTVRQCIEHADGTMVLQEAGVGAWHTQHSHHHHDDVVRFSLFEYDFESQTRGERLSTSQKFGWGFYPIGLLPESKPDLDWNDCRAPGAAPEDYSYGLARGWWDAYLWWRNGNYLDIADVPDGVYEFEVIANPKRLIHEEDIAPNTASVIIRITGDSVEALRPFQPDYGTRL